MSKYAGSQRVWFERTFDLGMPPEAQPELVERLRGTPSRLEERLSGVPSSQAVARWDGSWSIQEQAGHLADLETLWFGRVQDILGGSAELREADLENRSTWDARHNSLPLNTVLSNFREQRSRLVHVLEKAQDSDLLVTALHPRLRQPMTIVDLCFFIAEHDDHHLARITILRRHNRAS